jgi:LuxR family quorum sensing-dependent transcriptional regulator
MALTSPLNVAEKMDQYSGLSEALARINAAWSLPSLWSGVKEFAGRFGYSHMFVVDAARLVGGARDAVIYTDTPQLPTEIDRDNGEYGKHPLVAKGLKSPTPFLVSEVRADPGISDKSWIEHLADVVKRGEGLVVPVYRGNEPIAGISLGGEQPDTSPVVRAMLQVVAHAAIERLSSLREGKAAPAMHALTVRETQCLRYVAIGHADVEIGQILGISPRTVRFHVDSAKTKLGVATRVQAVAKALRERIIAV